MGAKSVTLLTRPVKWLPFDDGNASVPANIRSRQVAAMNITSFEFALFFAVVLPLNWLLRPRAGLYRLFLLLTSYVFYASFNAKFLLILLVFSFLTWFFAVVFAETSDARFRRFCLILYCGFALGMTPPAPRTRGNVNSYGPRSRGRGEDSPRPVQGSAL